MVGEESSTLVALLSSSIDPNTVEVNCPCRVLVTTDDHVFLGLSFTDLDMEDPIFESPLPLRLSIILFRVPSRSFLRSP